MELSEGSKAQAIVPRPRLAEALTLLGKEHAYVIVEGPKGCGKTTGVLLALSGKPGVLRVKLIGEADACVEIAKALRMPNADAMTQTMLEDVLRKRRKRQRARARPSRAEFSRNPERDEYGKEQVGVLKEVCADKGLANVIIVLRSLVAFATNPGRRP